MSAASAAGAGPASRRSDLLGLAGFLLACFAVAAAAGAVTADSVATWYPTLNKPAFTPPDWVFAPAWTVLYAAMAVAGWRVWRKVGFAGGRNALTLFAIQLLLNGVWSFLFFGAHEIGIALIDIVVLLLVIAATTAAFWRIDRIAGLLFVPYLLWVGYATALNAGIWLAN
ncbi:MAG: TspO/MBR family protein [Rhodospirillales bacterium]|nr:TspO/MBR family protein [Rhodospirillales bacterium]